MGNFWKVKVGFMSPIRYLLSIAFDVALLAFPGIFMEVGSEQLFFSIMICANLALVGEYLVRLDLFKDLEAVRKRYMVRGFLGMVTIAVALATLHEFAILFLPLLYHRIYFEMNLWVRSPIFSRINDLFLLSSAIIVCYLTFSHVWGMPILYLVSIVSLASWLSASMSGKEHALRDLALESRDRVSAIHKFLVESLKVDVLAELGSVDEICGDPDIKIPSLVEASLRKKWESVDSILSSVQTDSISEVDVKKTLQLIRRSYQDRCTLVTTFWGDCKFTVHGGLLSALLRSVLNTSTARSATKTTVWITVLPNRILITDNSGSSVFESSLVEAVTSSEFQEISGLDVTFETPVDGDMEIGARISIKM